MSYRIRVLGGGLELDFPGDAVEPPTAPSEVGALVLLALHAGRELSVDAFKIALYDCDPGLVSNATIHSPIARLRRAGLPIPRRHYVLDLEPSEVDIVDVDARARELIEAAAQPERLDPPEIAALVEQATEIHGIWRYDPAAAVGHRPFLSKLFDPHRRRHSRFGMAYVRLLDAAGDAAHAEDVLTEYVERYGDDAPWSELRRRLGDAAESGTERAAPADPVDWPVQVGRPPGRARAFQPRADLAAQIDECDQVVLVGSGGVGKSQLAADAFFRRRDDGVDLLVWVNASRRESILTTYAHARDETEPRTRGLASATEAAEGFLSWLGVTSRSWIVVLDDVADPVDIRGLWPEGRRGRVVATTRRRDLAPAGARQLAVDAFTPADAQRYLADRLASSPAQAAHPTVLVGADDLAEALGRLPVALGQAAAVILNDGVTCAEYGRRIADRGGALDRLFPDDAGVDDYALTVATTWSLSIEVVDQLEPVGLSSRALRVAAVLDPDGAPDALWGTTAVLGYLDAPAEDARAALRNLHRVSLLSHDPGGGPYAVRIHALTQRACLESLTDEERTAVVRVAADALAAVWPDTETDPALSRVLRQNVAALAAHETALWMSEGHQVLLLAGRSLGEMGLAHDAVAYWTDLVGRAERHLGPHHQQTLAIRHALADWKGVAGDYAGASAEMEQVLDVQRDSLGQDHVDVLSTRHGLAHWEGAAGRFHEAVASLERLRVDCEKVLGPDHRDTLAVRHSLADWTGMAGDARRAAAIFAGLGDDVARQLGRLHRTTLLTRRHLAYWQGVAGEADDAVTTLVQLADDCRAALGPEHPDTFATTAALAEWRGIAGDPAAAAAAFARLAEDCGQVLGAEHPDTFAARHGHADWQGAAGDPAAAVRGFQQVAEDRSRALGADHPATLTTRAGLGYWRGAAGDPRGAVRTLRQVVADRSRVLGAEHSDALIARHTLAYWQGVAGDVDGARAELDRLAATIGSRLGPRHPHTIAVHHTATYWQGVAGDVDGALSALKLLVNVCADALGPRHPHTVSTSGQLSRWSSVADGGADADAARREIDREQLRRLGPGRPHSVATRHGLADWRTGRVRHHVAPWSGP